jgi:hypothetical protein
LCHQFFFCSCMDIGRNTPRKRQENKNDPGRRANV